MTVNATVSSKGQITLPKAMRKRYGLSNYARVSIKDTGTHIIIEKKPSIEDYYGKLDGFWGKTDPAEDIRAWRNRSK